MINTKILLNGSEVTDFESFRVIKSIGDANISSNFSGRLNNFAGYNAGKYAVGQNIKVYAALNDSNPGSLVFNGIVEDINYEGVGIKEKMSVLGRDYSARLMDRTVEPEVYTNLQPGSIVQDIINKYTQDITTNNVVVAGSAISRISFVQIPVYEAIKQLSDINDYIFYVDNNKDLHFGPAGSISSGYTFDNTNVLQGDFAERRDTIYNQVWVYGDRYLDGFKEVFKAGSPVGGSVFTLLYNPHNTEIISGLAGSSVQPGAILNMSESLGSNVKYLVDYDSKLIIFTSGTTQGNNVPVSGNTFTVNYKRLLPIVKVGDDESSKSRYGERVKVITDKSIKDPRTAVLLMQSTLANSSEPTVEGNIEIDGVALLEPGQTVVANFPHNEIFNETYDVIQATYDFTKENCLHDHVITAKLNKKLPDLTDQIKEIMMELKKLKAQDITDADLITRFQTAAGSVSIRPSGILVYTKSIAGQGLIWGNNTFGIWGSGLWNDNATQSFVLGNLQAAKLGTSKLGINAYGLNMTYNSTIYGKYNTAVYGDAAGTNSQFQLVWSGGYF